MFILCSYIVQTRLKLQILRIILDGHQSLQEWMFIINFVQPVGPTFITSSSLIIPWISCSFDLLVTKTNEYASVLIRNKELR